MPTLSFSEQVADEFVAEYVEQSVRGMADVVLVPGEGTLADGFVCGKLWNRIKDDRDHSGH